MICDNPKPSQFRISSSRKQAVVAHLAVVFFALIQNQGPFFACPQRKQCVLQYGSIITNSIKLRLSRTSQSELGFVKLQSKERRKEGIKFAYTAAGATMVVAVCALLGCVVLAS